MASRSSLCTSALLLLGLAACGDESSPPRQPQDLNLILISLDTCRADRISPYGALPEHTPVLETLSRESAVFDDCLAQSTLTGPSHWSLFTGHHVHRHGVDENGSGRRPPRPLAQILRENGWRTAGFTGAGVVKSVFGFDSGFDLFLDGKHLERKNARRNLPEVVPEAIEWLDRERPERFFLFLHGYDPHCPYEPPEPFKTRYTGWYDGWLKLDGKCGVRDYLMILRHRRFGLGEKELIRDTYQALLASADAAIGKLIDHLRQQALLDRSIVVFTSDHGESLGEHDFVGHGRAWEEQLRVPLMIRFPDGKWIGRYSDPVQGIDLMPTLLEALGVDDPPGLQGQSLLPVLEGEALPRERMRLARVKNIETVRFDDRWKIYFERNGSRIERQKLFDLQEDPEEKKNLFKWDDGQARFEQIFARYDRWYQQAIALDAPYRAALSGVEPSAEDRADLAELGYTIGEDTPED